MKRIALKKSVLLLFVFPLAFVLLAGCTTTSSLPGKMTVASAKKKKMICFPHMKVGSHIAHTICLTPRQYQERENAHIAAQQTIMRTNTCLGPNC
jgi:hypothetical protein